MDKLSDNKEEVMTQSVDGTGRQGLAEVPLSDLLALRDRVGSKEFSKVYHNRTKIRTADPVTPRKDMDRPPEFSSKKRPRLLKRQTPNKQPRDPRFDDRSGAFNEDSFGRAYSFLHEVRQEERCEVEREVQRAGPDEDTKKLRALLDRMKAQERARKERARDREVEKSWMKEEREKVKKGKKRFHLKKSILRNMQLENRLARNRGRQEIDKRRKRLEKKSRKKIPQRRET
ncbi:Ribosomal RNA processing protein 36-like [Oopsacas minuta]|uniref:rRNA biogenesis protein RRP36 n=1 Tax=Oopsacas minuta TaxID=111878 RepID=A0AAV7K5J4_9METZ|nr:Ribosomal RNA processing protein 36-like [Oopsacas minuta]